MASIPLTAQIYDRITAIHRDQGSSFRRIAEHLADEAPGCDLRDLLFAYSARLSELEAAPGWMHRTGRENRLLALYRASEDVIRWNLAGIG